MRWHKHLNNLHRQESVSAFLDEAGLGGYGAFHILCEIVGEKIDNGDLCEVVLPMREWFRRLGVHHNKGYRLFNYMLKHSLIELFNPSVAPGLPPGYLEFTGVGKWQVAPKYDASRLGVRIPKLLLLKDEYSKKSGHCRENVRPKDIDIDINPDNTHHHHHQDSQAKPDLTKKPTVLRMLRRDGGGGNGVANVEKTRYAQSND